MQMVCNNDNRCKRIPIMLADLNIVSFVLAMLLGVISFLLIRHTADAFERWYDQPRSWN